MTHTLRFSIGLLAVGSLLTACADSTSPLASLDAPPSLKNGVGGGGGSAPAPKNGRIDRVSAAATCTAGSSFGITLQRGFDDRIEAVIVARAATQPTGPAVPPSLFPQTSLGGWQSFRVVDAASGLNVMSFAGTQGLATTSYQITNLGRGLPAGSYTFTFTTVNRQENGVTDYLYLQSLAPHETCTATLNATLR